MIKWKWFDDHDAEPTLYEITIIDEEIEPPITVQNLVGHVIRMTKINNEDDYAELFYSSVSNNVFFDSYEECLNAQIKNLEHIIKANKITEINIDSLKHKLNHCKVLQRRLKLKDIML